MAELPEIVKITNQMNQTLENKVVKEIIMLQEKCTNVALKELNQRLLNATINRVYNKGKWIILSFNNRENILLSLGMGADVLYFERDIDSSEKYQIKVLFTDDSGFTIRYWWFGKFLISSNDELSNEQNTKDIAIDPFDKDFTYEYFKNLLEGKKGQIKPYLMNQKNISGIGNMYMHDILFKAMVHPQKKISDLTKTDIRNLYDSILCILNASKDKGSFSYEIDFYGKKGGYTIEDFLIGYKEDKECPVCGSIIKQIKTGGNTSFICEKCQVLE